MTFQDHLTNIATIIGLSFMHKARSYEVITQGMYNAGMILFIMILLSLVWRIYHVGTKAKN